MTTKRTILSGIQPSGRPHIGNYFGMMKQMVDNQNSYTSYVFIVDYHALTTVRNAKNMRQGVLDVALDFLAIGLDPKKVVFFKQSDVKEHVELAWILNCVTPVSTLNNAHAFKDAQQNKNKEITAGLLTYPVLQAADILLYDVNLVPVGKDQRQHIEIAREIARKFNNIYGPIFTEPKSLIKKDVDLVIGSDGQKMSKSYNNHLPLFASEKETEKYIMSIPMDSKGIKEKKDPDDYNLYKIFKLFATKEEDKKTREMFEKGGVGYAEIKKHVAGTINSYLKPMREKRRVLAKNPKKVLKIIENGGRAAQKVANKKIKKVYKKVGL